MEYTMHGIDDILNHLESRIDTMAIRIKKLLQKPDLSRRPNTPIYFLVQAIRKIDSLKNHDLVQIPEIVSVKENFDLLGTPQNHPSRKPSDTFYIDENNILRTQTTTMWSYYLRDTANIKRLEKDGKLLALSYGKVYRNDEIDRYHYPVWHNVDGLCISKKTEKQYTIDDLVNVLTDIAKNIYGKEIKWRVEEDTFPFTQPSIELQIEWNHEWIEVLGAGLVHKKVLSNLNLNPAKYNGWAFGFGLDRLAMIKMKIPDIRILWSNDERITKQFKNINSVYTDVSKYPSTVRDISFVISQNIHLNTIYGLMRDCVSQGNEDIIEEVKLIDTYANDKKFGKGNVSYTFRIQYRSHVRTLTNVEINDVQEHIRISVKQELNAVLR